MQITLRSRSGREVVARFRRASLKDIPDIEQLIAFSARGLSRDDYTEDQIEAALGVAWGVDTQLIRDGTFFVAETEGNPVACGGWSWRKTLFGGDAHADREPELLDPTHDGARIRAFFVHPEWARQGLGTKTLELCETEARKSGFTFAELAATLPGQRLYRRCGYVAEDRIQHILPNGVSIEFVRMRKHFR